jgi:hypothetical protein
MYLTAQRVVRGTSNQFATPSSSTIQDCPGYNDYKYGLADRNTYMSRLSSTQIVNRYRDARVSVLLGELDDDPAAADLDTTCAAMLQGPTRLQRGLIHANYLRHVFGAAIGDLHRTIIVSNVGHSAEEIFRSPCGVAELFGGGGCDPVDAPDGPAGAAAPRLALASRPNPFIDRSTLFYWIRPGRHRVTLRVYDVRGRLVRTLHDDADADGRGSIVWDGRSRSGARVPAGVYWVRLQDGDATVVARSTRLR